MKKIIIRILPFFMLAAFVAVVSVQWIWIKYSIDESRQRFAYRVYSALERTVNRIDDINNARYWMELTKQLREAESVARSIVDPLADSATTTAHETVSASVFLGELLQYGRLQNRSVQNKSLNQNFLEQVITTMDLGMKTESDTSRQAMYNVIRDLMLQVMKEVDPENTTVERRLERVDLEKLLRENLSMSDIRLPFHYEVLKDKEVQKRSGEKNFFYRRLFGNDWMEKNVNLCLTFDLVDSEVYDKNLQWMFAASLFCIFGVMSVLIITLIIIMRQQKLSVIKNDFINNMTHEFKTPIATISLATAAIEKEKVLNDKNQLLKFNDMIRKENNRMNKYVERILLQAKLDRREIHLKKVEVNLNELVDEAVQHFKLQVAEKGGELREELDAEGLLLLADEVHMLNVVCNLIDNAIKYSYDSLNLYIFTRRIGDEFIIGVQDSGIGIPKEAQKNVFKRFYRVPSGNIHNVKGFGLGLSYVKSIVELHDGDIRLTSKKNKGTLVEIIFKIEQHNR